MVKFIKYLLFLLVAVATCQYSLPQTSGAGAKKDAEPIWLSDCEKKLEEYRKSMEVEPVSQFPPFFGKKIREMGYSLPLPFGVGVSSMIMRQTNKISDFNLVIQGEQVPYDLKFYNAVSTDMNLSFRPDIWIFPFLNVYGVAGLTSGSISPSIIVPGISVDHPLLGEIDIVKPIEINSTIEYKGTTYGIGSTAAGGFRSFFFTLDYNYTLSDMDVIPQTVKVHTLTPRVGILLDAFKTIGTGTLWIGAMYVDVNQQISDQVNLRAIDPELADILGDELGYEMQLGVADPWNFLLGGAWAFHPRMTLVIEAGIGDRSQFLASVDYRF